MDIKELYKIYQQHPVITTDSRDCPQGSIFIALKGESFNGNAFAGKALEQGCAYAVVDEPQVVDEDLKDRYILVDDCLQTFKDLAREHRRQFHIPVIGITGTNGKTTTKELVAAVLSEEYNVMATQGNFNNDVGVPKTLFRLTDEHDIAVVEMGASHPGDIKTLVETAEPTCGLITNVGRAHLQGFGSFEGVKRTKGELYDFLRSRAEEGDPDQGFIFINADDPDLTQMANQRGLIFQIGYGMGNSDEIVVKGEVTGCDPFVRFRWWIEDEEEETPQKEEVQTRLIGAYNVYNMLAAIAVGLHFDIDPENINHALENYTPSNNRSQLMRTANNTLIVDAYNANPTSMAAALRNFRDMQVGNKMAILGDMRELGDASEEEHQRIVDMLKEFGLVNTWLVGEEFAKTKSDFRKFKDVDEVREAIEACQPQGHSILIKGSNGTKLFLLPEVL
ncbi:MAG: UDP-N-acetylmuramoyl-tripeptide--D-alanyl-D-alanine ligase [Prevotella sp.]|nr:UDP-N-acetylmuramoyl-tripeptide--D-alanyl-D-alanine ligase [Prevotella sp.]